jgi:nucleoside-diphosphate-sugar epimerase
VTGALGCVGAWTLKALLEAGDQPVGFDRGRDLSRLRPVLGDAVTQLELVEGDITDPALLERVLDEREITGLVHLAALQVPACRDNPTQGAVVNVLGTVNVFEAVRRRLDRIPSVVYASSVAVYCPDDPAPAPEAGGRAPQTLYGIWKVANENTARIYWQDNGVPSIGLRPYVVYGPGRDVGLTSGPSLAMAAAARGEDFEIGYSGVAQYDYAPDVGRAFAAATGVAPNGAVVANYPGVAASLDEIVGAIEVAASASRITYSGDTLPFPETLESHALEALLGPVSPTPLMDGVRATIDFYRAALAEPADVVEK